MQHDTAGDAITGGKGRGRTTRKIAEELAALGIAVSKNTVGRLLKDMDFKLRVNRKQIASTKNPDRNQQFRTWGSNENNLPAKAFPSSVSIRRRRNKLATSKIPAPSGIANPSWSRIMIFARMPTAWRSPTAFTTHRPIGALCSWVPATTRRPLPSTPSLNGGERRDANDTRPPANYSSWLTAEEVTARDAAPGGKPFRTQSALLWVSSLPSPTIHQELPSGIPLSTACSAKSAKTGLANPLPTSTRSSSSSVPRKRNPASSSMPISSRRTMTPESRSQTRKCVNSTSFPTNCLAAGAIPYAPLRM